MDISIVTGTYNRLPLLQAMVNSARQSLDCYGLQHEFVIVDGGSNDGTQKWCKEQIDVNLIEHLSLLGAVKAFNDGAANAVGDYVILANDDIEFIGNSIMLAWIYMQEHNDCGIGCFNQDRGRQGLPDSDPGKYQVERMPVVRDGRPEHEPYGQVCIVPRWLGDYVGWWGDYLHTYGGDNEISSMVYTLGFKVSPVPGAKIHDKEPDDELRRKNNIKGHKDPKAVKIKDGYYHPDSAAWGRKWKHGPIIKAQPILENNTSVKERILYLPIYEVGWQVQKKQKRGLREALAKMGLVKEVDYFGYSAEHGQLALFSHLLDICHDIHPTLILSQIHNGDILTPDSIRRLRMANPQAKLINWNGDFWPDNLLSKEGIELAKTFDLQLTINRDALDQYKALGVNADYWQIGYEPDGVGCGNFELQYDVVFLGNGYSAQRRKLGKFLSGLNGIKLGLYGSGWVESKGQTTYDFIAGCKIYQSAKISIGDSQWPETGFVSNRIFQALAAGGAMLAHEWFRDMDLLGLIDGETCIIWKSHAELEEKIRYYLNHENERKRIADAGQQMCLTRHSFDVRVAELFEMLEMEKVDHWRL